MAKDRISATRRIAASTSDLFAIVAHPHGHTQIDGSGMLRAAPGARPLTRVGETFEMEMDRAPLRDTSGLGIYTVRNTVTRLRPDRLVEWAVGGMDGRLYGHVYGWLLDPVSEHETAVTNYCDWSGISDGVRARQQWPVVPVHMLESSVERLNLTATAGRPSRPVRGPCGPSPQPS